MTSYAIYLGPEVQKDTLGLDQICTSTLDHLCLFEATKSFQVLELDGEIGEISWKFMEAPIL